MNKLNTLKETQASKSSKASQSTPRPKATETSGVADDTMAESTIKPITIEGKIMEYIVGFIASLGLTLTAYAFVVGGILQSKAALYVLATLAIIQTIIQLVFFLHLRNESEPRWKLLAFDFMLIVVVIIVFGSIWIMDNLNYNMMPPHETDQQVMEDEGIYR